MYKGKKRFDREQLIFIVEVAMSAVLDKIDGSLPTNESELENDDSFYDKSIESFRFGSKEVLGIFVPILWAQTVGGGMATNDFDYWDEFEDMVQNFIETRMSGIYVNQPDCHELAEKIVDSNWREYLAES